MSTRRAVFDQPIGWLDLQKWFKKAEDPLRPWNVSAISRILMLPQSIVRALLKGPKDSPGMSRAAFSEERLKTFEQLFGKYGYQSKAMAGSAKVGHCRPVQMESLVRPIPIEFTWQFKA